MKKIVVVLLLILMFGCDKKIEQTEKTTYQFDEWEECDNTNEAKVFALEDWDTFEDSKRKNLYVYLEIKIIDETHKVKCYYIDEETKQLHVEFE